MVLLTDQEMLTQLSLLPKGMGAVFFNKGENCIAAGRLFVEESIHDEFVTRVVRQFQMCFMSCAEIAFTWKVQDYSRLFRSDGSVVVLSGSIAEW
jgi:hypothetical protein